MGMGIRETYSSLFVRNLFYQHIVQFIKLSLEGVLHPRPVFGLFLHFSQKLQHTGNK